MKVLANKLVQDDGTPIPFIRSPNQRSGIDPQFLVMHYTAGPSAQSSINWLTNQASNASAHVVIGRDGDVTQLVAFNQRAFHAGRSSWLGFDGLNGFSLGIELDNAGQLIREDDHWKAWFGTNFDDSEVIEAVHRNRTELRGWPSFPAPQIEAALEVVVVEAGDGEHHVRDAGVDLLAEPG